MKLLAVIILFLGWRVLIPSVNAGDDISIFEPRDSVRLSCSTQGSYSFLQWSMIQGMPGATIVSPNDTVTMIRSMKPGVYRFRVVVFDASGNSDADTMTVNVLPKSRRLIYRNIVMLN